MNEKFAKSCTYALLIAIVASSVAIASSNSIVLAQPCQAVLGSPNLPTQPYSYYQSNFQVTVPVSASCSFFTGQLYATGTAYDTTYNSNIGTANTILTSTYGGYGYTGQLTFYLPASAAQSHSVQFSVSVYGSLNGYYGGYYGAPLLAQTTSTFVIGPSYYQGYPTYPSYSTPSYPSYTPSYPYYPYYGYYYHYSNGGYYYGSNRYYCRSWRNSCTPH